MYRTGSVAYAVPPGLEANSSGSNIVYRALTPADAASIGVGTCQVSSDRERV